VSARRPFLRLMARRLGAAVPGLVGVVVVTFFLMRALPGDPAAYFAGNAASKEAIEQVRAKLGLDKSLPEQFVVYVRDLARGDLGQSVTTGQPVRVEMLARLPASLELTVTALLLAVAVALPAGVLAATRPGSLVDQAVRVLTTAGVSLPTFFTGLLLVYVFYYLLGWAPSPTGRLDSLFPTPPKLTGFYLADSLLARDLEIFRACLKQLALPAVTMALFVMAPLARMTRASMLGVLGSDFIRTARASGLAGGTVLWTYAFRNAMLPVVTTLGMIFSFMLGANVLVEKVFAWPGIGSFALEALLASDYAPVQGFILTMATLYVLLNLGIDILYGLIDPRVRIEA
jgi:ABC-type dipeptide/oligopeptide/nickel transport system permease component